MTQSMTAFARKETSFSFGSLSWEIRSVNHRYLEPHLKVPELLRDLELPARDRIRAKLSRGKVECLLRYQGEMTELPINLDQRRLGQLIEAVAQIRKMGDQLSLINPLELLQYPGVVSSAGLNTEAVSKSALELLDSALDSLVETRIREGQELANLVVQRLDAIAEILVQVRAELPRILEAQRTQLQTKISHLTAELEPQRLEQEIVLLAQRADVAEELDRLATHVSEVHRVLGQKGPIGRRLDFLMQELNRETNTLASKSIVTSTTQSAVELKVLIEQMREQIQNIE